jgi:dihydroxyacetone kinase
MNAMESEETTQAVAAIMDATEAIRDLVPVAALSMPLDQAEAGAGGDRLAALIQKIGATPLVELEKLIGELQAAKTYLQSEGERIEREAVGYVELGQTALESVKIIAETVGEWRKAGHPVRRTNGG